MDNLNSSSFARLDNGTQLFAGDVIARSGATQYSLIGAYTRLNSLQSSIDTINSTLTNHGNRIAALEAWKATCNGNLAACGNAGSLGGGGATIAFKDASYANGSYVTFAKTAVVSVSMYATVNYFNQSSSNQGDVTIAAIATGAVGDYCSGTENESTMLYSAGTVTAYYRDTCVIPAGTYQVTAHRLDLKS